MLIKTFGSCRFLYNIMLEDKIRAYQETKKMLKNTPAQYKKEYPWLKEVDSLALANVQLHLEAAYRSFFRDPKIGFPKFKSKHRSRNSYTTNVVNGNISIENGSFIGWDEMYLSILLQEDGGKTCQGTKKTFQM